MPIDARGRRLAVLGSAAAVLAVVAGIAIAVALRPDRADPVPDAALPPAPGATGAPAAPNQVSIAAGWLPPGRVTPSTMSAGYGSERHDYDIVAPDGDQSRVQLTLDRAEPDVSSFGDTVRATTVAGRPAREWPRSARYTTVIREPDGRFATVVVFATTRSGDPYQADRVAGIGRQVAAGLRLGRTDPIRPAFRLTYTPAGLPVRSLSVDPHDGTWYELAPPTAPAGRPAVLVVGVDRPVDPKGTAPGTPVQGHPTAVLQTPTGPALLVRDLRPGLSVSVGPNQVRGPSLAELYRIADGIR